MENRKLLNLISLLVFLGLIVFLFYSNFKKDEERQEQSKEQQSKEETNTSEYLLIKRTTYEGNYRVITRLYSTGRLERAKVVDETIMDENYKEEYAEIGNLEAEELNTIIETVKELSNETFKRDNFSNPYGIEIRLNPRDSILYSAEYFTQDKVNKIYYIMNKY